MSVFLLTLAAASLITGDYLVSLLNGAKIDQYVAGGLQCAEQLRDTQYAAIGIIDYFQGERPAFRTERISEAYFNVSGQILNTVPDAFYLCYQIPRLVNSGWNSRLNTFKDTKDFTDGFFQNLLGNVFTIQDAINQIQTATEQSDYIQVVFQIGRLFRRMFDFQPVSGHTLQQQCVPDIPALTYNFTTPLSRTIMTIIGFYDGAYSNYNRTVTNVTSCRIAAIIFTRNDRLWQQSKLLLDKDYQIYYFVQWLDSLAEFQTSCYWLLTESNQAYREYYTWQVSNLHPEIYYEAGTIMTQARTISQIITMKYNNQVLQDKHYYVMARSMGIVYDILGTHNYEY